jgi:Raf kinase inhibitor-like YbhB/YbcL family protein
MHMTMKLTCTAFKEGTDIPAEYTCDGDDHSPPLAWSGVPGGARSLALIVHDPDAPDPAAPKMDWVHWVVFNISPQQAQIEAGAAPPGASEGVNDWKQVGYRGPCPPVGRHRYYFTLYALDCELPAMKQATRAQLEQAMQGHVLAEATLLGHYQH